MTAHDAAVRAVAEALCLLRHPKYQAVLAPSCAGCGKLAEAALAAFATSADVRDGLVDALTEAAISHPHGGLILPAIWRATAEWNVDALLAPLGGAG